MEFINWIIRMFKQKHGHGFSEIVTQNSVTKEDYEFGSGQMEARFGASKVIRPDGQWDEFLPKKELQKFSWGDTFHCTVYGDENMVQTLMKAKYGEQPEYSERYLGVLAGIRNHFGGSPHTVFEKWRKYGNVGIDKLPFESVRNWNDFNSPNPMTKEMLDEGKKWLEQWEIGHEWIWSFRHSNLMKALQYSPLGVGVYAWSEKGGKQYQPKWARQNHWVMLYGYEEGSHWKVYDHYDDVHKKLEWNYNFRFLKSITLKKKTVSERSDGEKLYNRFKGTHVFRAEKNGEAYEVREDKLKYCFQQTNCEWLQAQLKEELKREVGKGSFTPLSEKDFTSLAEYYRFQGKEITNS